ncbi:ribose phosphate diphosphokinase subunit PRS5 KNAG_0K01160 [Huiozyma naganishii CBS 8797]|uniref:ribose-phosphate diphosphokinase n=1 Tax=Huiozyma naganishii (strain ATCC MYA-139 / BCRC 22969 / CBS 8797 / KCTC 17520 / NBRC 10181 / NCYC 3082 / Yp74L-3) TaxID=1071383 RepID=J7SAV1_HUIN7|nr:hypothetical protein KNAG_0K01160 [Kazachstania naganishii CBS 8797]CCK72481.1 hypothetical protein KNAG_0K01160 [Kazachstania naganishii CBS 8797]
MSNNLVIFGGDSHPKLVAQICAQLDVQPSKVELGKFSNGETSIAVKSSVREKDVYVIQSGCGHVNDTFMQLLILISACKSASASRVTAVIPYFCYSRQPDIPYTAKGAPIISQRKSSGSASASTPAATPTAGGKTVTTTQRPGADSPFKSLDSAIRSTIQSPTPVRPPPTTVGSSRIPMIPEGGKLNRSGGQQTPQPPSSTSAEAEELFNAQNAGYKLWVVQAGTLIANLLTAAGADHVITMDLHDRQFPGFFDVPVDNLYCKPLVQNYIHHCIPGYRDAVVVSPDAGGAKRATAVADALELSFAMIHKERRSQLLKGPPDATLTSGADIPSKPLLQHNPPPAGAPALHRSGSSSSVSSASSSKFVQTTMIVGDVRGKTCILVDDLVDTSYTITRAAVLLKDQGATAVYAIATHGVFSGDALERIKRSPIDKIVVSNTIPQERTLAVLGKHRVDILDVSRVFGEAIRRIHNGESISMLFEYGW